MKRSAWAIVFLVGLRLALGAHFFDAGVEKMDPSFSSAGFLRGAKGPLAPTYRSFVTGPYDATSFLQKPVNANDDDALDSAKADVGGWLERIESDRSAALARVARLGASDEQLEQVRAAAEAALEDLAAYVTADDRMDALVDLRHEAWRLKEMRDAAGGEPAPFQSERIEAKEGEVWGSLQPWLKAAEQSDDALTATVTNIVADSVDAGRVRSALQERSRLNRVDNAVMLVLLCSGVLLFFGLFTPLAAVAAAGFVLSAMATQPPWVDGANTTYFFYQLVEVVALATIAAVGAGRWAGLDRLVFGRPMIVAEPTDLSGAAG